MDRADCLAKGRAFHRQLFAQIGDLHPEDEAHDVMVGQTLTVLLEQDPARAIADYNDWAVRYGYVPVEWWGTFTSADGQRCEWVDIREALICLQPDYTVTVLMRREPCPSS